MTTREAGVTGCRALLVDDSDEIRDVYSYALRQEGMECDEAADGVIAENLLRLNRYDVVVTDLRMPRKHGHKLVQELLDSPRPPLIVVLTGVAEARLTADLIRRGVADVMYKPIAPDVFAAKVRARLDVAASQKAAPADGAQVPNVTEQIGQVTATLKDQLAAVTESFQKTITDLEKQQDLLETGFVGSVRVLRKLFAQLSNAEGSHVGRVEKMAMAIARETHIKKDQLLDVGIAALLHDIGQFGMPDDVRVLPPWSLNAEQRRAFENYPTIGATLLSEVPGTENAVRLIESHAENFDGTGFPARKQGNSIPIGALIIRVADGCDTYLKHTDSLGDLEKARDHLTSQKGKAYAPNLVGPAFAYLMESAHAEEGAKTCVMKASELYPGLVVAEDVYDAEGHFLVRQDAELTADMLPRLKKLLRAQKVSVIAPQKEQE